MMMFHMKFIYKHHWVLKKYYTYKFIYMQVLSLKIKDYTPNSFTCMFKYFKNSMDWTKNSFEEHEFRVIVNKIIMNHKI